MNGYNGVPVSNTELLRRLDRIEDLKRPHIKSVRVSHSVSAISAAKWVLQECGYRLSRWDMVEGDFYQLVYVVGPSYTDTNRWPQMIKLRYLTTDGRQPLMLRPVYYQNGELEYYQFGLTVFNRKTQEAQDIETAFAKEYPDKQCLWLPRFTWGSEVI